MGRISGVSPDETKGRLLKAAADVFERKGFEKATVAEIAREAGVSSGAIYAHYSGKAALLTDALRCHSGRAIAALFPPNSKFDTGTVLITLAEKLAAREPSSAKLLAEALLAARRDSDLGQVLVDALAGRSRTMAAMIAAGQANGAFTADVSADVVARFALMLGLGSSLVSALELPPVDQHAWNTFVRRFIGAFIRETAERPPLAEHTGDSQEEGR